MGSADIIPGVSGGTVAFITGIYEQFIDALKSINFDFIYHGIRGIVNHASRQKANESLQRIHWQFLAPLALGIFVAFLVLANIVGFFLDTYPTYTFAFFFGLIFASAILIYLSHRDMFLVSSLLFVVLGCIFGYYIVGLQAIQMDHSYFIIFLTGIVSFCAMILPGLSGAFILLVLGQYEFMLNVLRNLTHLELGYMTYAVAYVLGGIVGLLLFSRVLSYLLKHYRKATLGFIIGLMVGALRLPVDHILANPQQPLIVIFSILLGIGIVSMFGYFDRKRKIRAKQMDIS